MANLMLGSSGIEVIKLQKALIKIGFDPGSSSGTFDTRTRDAVLAFQRSRVWLVADGIVGPISQAEINSTVEELDGNKALQAIASGSQTVTLASINSNPPLAKSIQRRLRNLGLYPGGQLIDGDFGSRSQRALREFSREQGLPAPDPIEVSPRLAQALIDVRQIPNILEVRGRDTSQILKKFKDIENFLNANDSKLAFLDMNVDVTAFKTSIPQYSARLSATASIGISTSAHGNLTFSPYPVRGKEPVIKTTSLRFLDPAITEACVVLGNITQGRLEAVWLGKNALKADECLSATKIIPILNVISQLGNNIPSDIESIFIQNQGTVNTRIRFSSALVDIVSYRGGISRSNSLARMFKHFAPPNTLEGWIRRQTGNQRSDLVFEGPYGAPAFINLPEAFDISANRELLVPPAVSLGIDNDISVYDLARLMSMIGWHQLLPDTSKLEKLVWRGLETFITALGTDTARYLDVALETLGLVNVISSPVILSKLGYGNESLVYVAFVQFIDEHRPATPRLRTFTIALRTDKNPPDASQAVFSDIKMAGAVTEIVRRIVMEEEL